MKVLITNDSYHATLGMVRSLGRKGIQVSVLSDDAAVLASHSRYCAARYDAPSADLKAFLPRLLNILSQARFDLVIPIGYDATAALARRQLEINSLTRLEIADYDKIYAAADKRFALELASRLAVPVPRTVWPTGWRDAAMWSAGLDYPVVIKARRETPSEPVLYPRSRSELVHFYQLACERLNGTRSQLPLIQEFIPGFGCGFFALYQHGVCKRIFMHKRVREVPPSGGVSCCATSFYDPKLKEYGKRLLDHLGWHGVAMAEFRYDERDNEYKLLEINPKFWGSLDLALAAGVDFPYDLCRMSQGGTIEYSEEYDRNLRYHWPLLEMRHVWTHPASLGAVLADFVNPRVQSNLSLFDITPNALEPFSRLRARVRKTRRGATNRSTVNLTCTGPSWKNQGLRSIPARRDAVGETTDVPRG